MNPVAIELESAIYPISIGATAPPTIDMMRNDEALFLCPPTFLSASAKIVGNMTDSHKKQSSRQYHPTFPGSRITAVILAAAQSAHPVSTFSALMARIIQLPPIRPAMKSPIPPKESHTDASCADTPAASVA